MKIERSFTQIFSDKNCLFKRKKIRNNFEKYNKK